MTDTPICEQPSHRKTRNKQPVSHPTSDGSILLVEDNDAHALLTQFFLEDLPLAVHVDRARDGEEALAYLFQRGPYEADGFIRGAPTRALPALILLDLHLPKLGGLEVLQQIKASRELKEIPVVMLSTSEAEADVAAAYALHANGYLIKPFGAAQFASMIEALATYWLKWNYPMPRQSPSGKSPV